MEQEIVSVLERIPFAKTMLAVKGISAISLAGILGEYQLFSPLAE